MRIVFYSLLYFLGSLAAEAQASLYAFPWIQKDIDKGCYTPEHGEIVGSFYKIEAHFAFINTTKDTIKIREVRHVGIAKIDFSKIIAPGDTGVINYDRFQNFNSNSIEEVFDLLQVNSTINPFETVSVRAICVGANVHKNENFKGDTIVYLEEIRKDELYNKLVVDSKFNPVSLGKESKNGQKWNTWKYWKNSEIKETTYGYTVVVQNVSMENLHLKELQYSAISEGDEYIPETLGKVDFGGSQFIHLKVGTTRLEAHSDSLLGWGLIDPESIGNSSMYRICIGPEGRPYLYNYNMAGLFGNDTTVYGIQVAGKYNDSIYNAAIIKKLKAKLTKYGASEFEEFGKSEILRFNVKNILPEERNFILNQIKDRSDVAMLGIWYSGCSYFGGTGMLTGKFVAERKQTYPDYLVLEMLSELGYPFIINTNYSTQYIELVWNGLVNYKAVEAFNKISEMGIFKGTSAGLYFPVSVETTE